MLTYKAFTILLILFGAPDATPTVVRTFNEADSFQECSAKAQDIAADEIWKHPVGAVCIPTSLLVR